jgi:iron(III) transport system substrate-binding protein
MRDGNALSPVTLFAHISAALLCLVLVGSANAAAISPATLSGPDRTQLLIAGAKKEGTLALYSSTALEDMTAVIAGFEKKYGIKVRLWRGGSEDILTRVLTEARAGRHDVDVVETSTSEMAALSRENLFQPVTSPVFAELMPEARPNGRPWAGSRIFIYSTGYNTRLVRKEDAPGRYEDLLLPKWKGKLGIEGTDSNWFMTLVTAMGEQKGLALFRDIVARNGVSVRRGHTLLSNLVISGEVALALNIYPHEIVPMKQSGAPIQELYLAPTIAEMGAGGVTKWAPHPYAAVLFLDFLLSDGQKIWADMQRMPTNLKYQHLPPGVKLTFVDGARYVRENAKWQKLYKDVLGRN